jgi:LmbE family N-acetylglucosaminyl deacetylase
LRAAIQNRMIKFKLVFKFPVMRFYVLLIFLLPLCSLAQPTRQPDAAQIELKLKKLNFLGSVLYMAAHPDDENTNLIAYLSNENLAATAYLSLTRGDGGQNLIGPEIRELLGLIRTQELLAARSIDGGQQFFTRAIDFGYSKSADEAFDLWGKEAVLSDAIKILRQFQPDIIITRFPPDARAGHGHHTASAIVAGEAFDLAAKPDIYPEQVKELGTWQVKRLYTNTGRWWNQSVNSNTPGVITLDVGGYNALLGKSYSEISALSSSQHKSQGWGRRAERGYRPQFLEHVKGEPAKKNIFEGIDTTWSRIGGSKIQILINRALEEFNPQNPAAIVPLLFRIRNEILTLRKSIWKDRKLRETEQLIVDCLGLFIEVTAATYQCAPGETIRSSIEILNRSAASLQISRIRASGLKWDSAFAAALITNKPTVINLRAAVSPDAGFSEPYWLKSPSSTGLYTVTDKQKIGMPQDNPAVNFSFELRVGDENLTLVRPMIYNWVDPVEGELWRPFEIVPPVLINLSENVLVFAAREPKQVTLVVRSASDENISGVLKLDIPEGWRAEPALLTFELPARGAEQSKIITVYPSSSEYYGTIKAVATVNEKQYDQSLQIISYDHFPVQTLLPPAQAKAVRIDLKKEGNMIAYIRGAGDEIPSALRNMGYEVWEMNNDEITLANLKRADAVVLGVRALNTNDRARYFMPVVLDYVKEGGTAVVQYNTNSRLETENFSPYPLTIGRERVADETSEVRLVKPDHPVVNIPNKITAADFSGWVQERGLYFPSTWDERFQAILSMNDKGEAPHEGSLLVAQYGKGHYVYTGLSFFRELPEGIPGAYKLFANLVSLGKNERSERAKNKDRSR